MGMRFAAVTLVLFAPQPLAHLAGAFAVTRRSFRWLYLLCAVLTLATAIWLRSRHERGGDRRP